MRWLYHIIRAGEWTGGALRPASLATQGFVHCSYSDAVATSAALYFPAGADLEVLQIDPRLLSVPLREDPTPRGPMPHVYGLIPAEAVLRRFPLAALDALPDRVDEAGAASVQ